MAIFARDRIGQARRVWFGEADVRDRFLRVQQDRRRGARDPFVHDGRRHSRRRRCFRRRHPATRRLCAARSRERPAASAGPARNRSASGAARQGRPAKGQAQAKVCTSCHAFEKGGPNKIGPDLWNVVNGPRARTRASSTPPRCRSAKPRARSGPSRISMLHRQPEGLSPRHGHGLCGPEGRRQARATCWPIFARSRTAPPNCRSPDPAPPIQEFQGQASRLAFSFWAGAGPVAKKRHNLKR